MAAMDFPATPTVGQLYPDPPTMGVPQYRWDGGAWLAVSTPEDLSYVRRTGDVMTGFLTLSGPPTAALHAVPKSYVDSVALPMRGHLHGLQMGALDASWLRITPGEAVDDGAAVLMKLPTVLDKNVTGAWAAGGVGGWDGSNSGAPPANGSFHIFLIQRSDTGVVDALMSHSATAPTMPASYDRKRRIGSWWRGSGANYSIYQHGDWFFAVNALLYNSPAGTASTLIGLQTPFGVRCKPLLTTSFQMGGGGDVIVRMAPGDDLGSLAIYQVTATNLGADRVVDNFIGPPSNLSAQIILNVDVTSGTLGAGIVYGHGWIDHRGRVD